MEKKLEMYADAVTLLKKGYSPKKVAEIAYAPYCIVKEIHEYLKNGKVKS